jgi:hypothetical protein
MPIVCNTISFRVASKVLFVSLSLPTGKVSVLIYALENFFLFYVYFQNMAEIMKFFLKTTLLSETV